MLQCRHHHHASSLMKYAAEVNIVETLIDQRIIACNTLDRNRDSFLIVEWYGTMLDRFGVNGDHFRNRQLDVT